VGRGPGNFGGKESGIRGTAGQKGGRGSCLVIGDRGILKKKSGGRTKGERDLTKERMIKGQGEGKKGNETDRRKTGSPEEGKRIRLKAGGNCEED